jgi:hypothetical protein
MGLPQLGVFVAVAIIVATALNTLGVFTEDAIHWTNWLIGFAFGSGARVWLVCAPGSAQRAQGVARRARLWCTRPPHCRCILVGPATDLRRRCHLPRCCRISRADRRNCPLGRSRRYEPGISRSDPRCAGLRQRHRFPRLVQPPASSSRSSIRRRLRVASLGPERIPTRRRLRTSPGAIRPEHRPPRKTRRVLHACSPIRLFRRSLAPG